MAESQYDNTKLEERKRLVREFVGEHESTALRELTKYTKLIGSFLLKGMNTFNNMFRKHLEGKPQFSQGKEPVEGEQDDEGKKNERRAGLKVNFSSFMCDEGQLESVRFVKNQPEAKPVRSFHFNMQDFQEEHSMDVSSKEDLSSLLNRIGTKKIKRDETCPEPDNLCKVISLETPEIRDHWNQIFNKVTEDWVLAASNLKDKNERQKKKNNSSDDIAYKNYMKDVGKDLTEGYSFSEGGKRLTDLMRVKRQRVQQRPRRKQTHIEEETPQIYNVQRVLEVLEKQKQEFIAEKQKKIQEARRIEREARRLQEQAREKQRKALELLEVQRKEEEERRLREMRQAQERQNLEQVQTEQREGGSFKEKQSQKIELSVISQKEELNIQNPQDEDQNTLGLSLRRPRNANNGEEVCQVSPQSLELSPKKEEKLEKSEEINRAAELQTPTKQNQKAEQKSSIPGLSEEKRKNNPFIKTSPAVGLSLQDFISKDSKLTPFQTLMNSSSASSSNFFSQNNGLSQNMFAPQTPGREKQQPAQSYSSPTNFMNNQIGMNFPSNPVPFAPAMPYGSPNSMMNQQANSSFQSSNANSSFGSEQPQMFSSNQQNSGPSILNAASSTGLGMFTNNSNAVKLFENNIFMNQTQVPSLFGDSTSQQRQSSSSRVSNRSKRNPVRIIS